MLGSLSRSDLRTFLSDVVALWDKSGFRWSSDSFGSKVSLATGSPCGTSSGLLVFTSPSFSFRHFHLGPSAALSPLWVCFFYKLWLGSIVYPGGGSCESLP